MYLGFGVAYVKLNMAVYLAPLSCKCSVVYGLTGIFEYIVLAVGSGFKKYPPYLI